MPDLPVVQILYDALNSEHGVVVRTNNPRILRQRLYAEKRKDPETFGILSLNPSRTAPETELLVIRNVSKSAQSDPESP